MSSLDFGCEGALLLLFGSLSGVALLKPTRVQAFLSRYYSWLPPWWPLRNFHRSVIESELGIWTIRIVSSLTLVYIFVMLSVRLVQWLNFR